jgi:hypothetical protein
MSNFLVQFFVNIETKDIEAGVKEAAECIGDGMVKGGVAVGNGVKGLGVGVCVGLIGLGIGLRVAYIIGQKIQKPNLICEYFMY